MRFALFTFVSLTSGSCLRGGPHPLVKGVDHLETKVIFQKPTRNHVYSLKPDERRRNSHCLMIDQYSCAT